MKIFFKYQTHQSHVFPETVRFILQLAKKVPRPTIVGSPFPYVCAYARSARQVFRRRRILRAFEIGEVQGQLESTFG